MKKIKTIKETFKNMFIYYNINQLPSGIEKITLFSLLNRDISLRNLTKVSALLEILTHQRSHFLRAKSSSTILKQKKGIPVGAKVTLRKSQASNFSSLLLYDILPQFKELKSLVNQRKFTSFSNSFVLHINNPLLFKDLKTFYFFFKGVCSLTISTNFKRSRNFKESYFYTRFFKVPSKQKS
jgi:ribosomal protein L5